MKNKLTVLGAVLLVVGSAQMAGAVPAQPGLYLVDTATGSTAFAAALSGVANFNGPLGGYTEINVTGTLLAGGADPSLELDVATAVVGDLGTTLQIYFSDGAFSPIDSAYSMASTGPATGGPVISSMYLGSGLFSTATFLAGSVDVNPSTVNGTGTINDGSSYYLTLEDLVTQSASGVDSTFTVTVPEPSSVSLLLLGLALPGAFLMRKKLAA